MISILFSVLLQQQQAQQQAQSSQPPSVSSQTSLDHASRDSQPSRMPETLEQLKIGLESITHVHVITSKPSSSSSSTHSAQQQQQPIQQQQLDSHGQVPPNEYLVQQSQQPIYQAQEYVPEVQPEVAQEYVLDGNTAFLEQQILQQQQQQQLQLQQQHLLNIMTSSQDASMYNSRRTSADMNVQPVVIDQQQQPHPVPVQQQSQTQPGSIPTSVPAVSAAGSDASTPNLRDQEKRLSNQGSVDRIDR